MYCRFWQLLAFLRPRDAFSTPSKSEGNQGNMGRRYMTHVFPLQSGSERMALFLLLRDLWHRDIVSVDCKYVSTLCIYAPNPFVLAAHHAVLYRLQLWPGEGDRRC